MNMNMNIGDFSMEMIGDDGFPIPSRKKLTDDSFTCVCPICMSGDATMKVAKTGNWNIRCHNCKILLYLNSVTSINLFRGLQSFLNEDPEHQVRHTAGLIAHAPDEGK
jgi:hypothetical protein